MNTTETASPQEQARQRTQHLMGTPDPREESPAIQAIRTRINQLKGWYDLKKYEDILKEAQQDIEKATQRKAAAEEAHAARQQEITQLEAAIETLKKANP